MKRYHTAELRCLEIVNLCDGARLGYATDFELEIEEDCARVTALIINKSSGFFGFGCVEELVIPWRKVECIGEDAILVRLPSNELSTCFCHRRRGKGRPIGGKKGR